MTVPPFMFIPAPPFNGFILVAYATLHTGFLHAWVLMVSRVPVGMLSTAAMALAALWMWTMHRCIPSLGYVLAAWS